MIIEYKILKFFVIVFLIFFQEAAKALQNLYVEDRKKVQEAKQSKSFYFYLINLNFLYFRKPYSYYCSSVRGYNSSF